MSFALMVKIYSKWGAAKTDIDPLALQLSRRPFSSTTFKLFTAPLCSIFRYIGLFVLISKEATLPSLLCHGVHLGQRLRKALVCGEI